MLATGLVSERQSSHQISIQPSHSLDEKLGGKLPLNLEYNDVVCTCPICGDLSVAEKVVLHREDMKVVTSVPESPPSSLSSAFFFYPSFLSP